MIVTCPACEAQFQVRPEALGPQGRKVRCTSCSETWHQVPESAAESPEEATPESVAPSGDTLRDTEEVRKSPRAELERLREERRKVEAAAKKAPTGLLVGWGILAVLVGGVVAGGLIARDTIIEVAPPSEKVYHLLGLIPEEVPGEGLALEDVNSIRRKVGDTRILILTGEIANVSQKSRKVPRLRASLTDSSGQELAFWLFSVEETELEPGARAHFETSTENPPADGTQLSIGFVHNQQGG